jgi:hypothetical protein
MKKKYLIALSVVIVFSVSSVSAQDDISSILNQIKGEKAAPKNTAVEKKSSSASSAKPKQNKSGKSSQKSSSPKEKIPVWNPKDKLPKDVTGHGVAGNFVIQSESYEGFAVLVPAEDSVNPFARQFKVENMSTGFAPGTVFPAAQRKFVRVSRSRPLIIVGRDPMPGIYRVQAR